MSDKIKPKEKKFTIVLVNGKRVYQCIFCYRNFTRFNCFTYHIKSRESNYPFQCEVCCEKRQKKSLLRNHIQKYHIKMGKATDKGSDKGSKTQRVSQDSMAIQRTSQQGRMGATNIKVPRKSSGSSGNAESQSFAESSNDNIPGSQEDEEQDMDTEVNSNDEPSKIPQAEVEEMNTPVDSNDELPIDSVDPKPQGAGDEEEDKTSNDKMPTSQIDEETGSLNEVNSNAHGVDDHVTITSSGLDKEKEQDGVKESKNNEWIFRLWALLPLDSPAYSNCSEQEKIAMRILQGTSVEGDVEEFVKLLDAVLETCFGTFIASIIVVSVFKKVKAEALLENYERLVKVEFSPDLKFVINELMLGIFRTKRMDLYKSKVLIPENIASVIFLNSNSHTNPINNDITGNIMQNIYNVNTKYKFNDKKVPVKTRVKMWCKIYQTWCDNLFESNSEFISNICVEASKMKLATDFTVVLNNKDEVYLHSAALGNALGMKIKNNLVESSITRQDYEIMAGLLYGKGGILKGGYRCEMLDLLFEMGCKPQNVYNFLFKDKKTIQECFSSFEYDNLLYYLIKLRKIRADKANFLNWNLLFKGGCVLSKIKKLNVNDIKYMLGKDGFEIGDVDIYKFLVIWCTENTCQFDKIRCKDYEKGKEKFDEVKGLIKNVENLREIFDIVCLHDFLDISDYL